jgi:hypothetical protein
VPDHSTLSRRAETLEVPRPQASNRPVHLLVDSAGLQLCGPGEWLAEKHGNRARRSWRKPHIGVDADTGRIFACALTPGTKIHLKADFEGQPLALDLTGREASDSRHFEILLDIGPDITRAPP